MFSWGSISSSLTGYHPNRLDGIPDPCRKSESPACLIFGMSKGLLGVEQGLSSFFKGSKPAQSDFLVWCA